MEESARALSGRLRGREKTYRRFPLYRIAREAIPSPPGRRWEKSGHRPGLSSNTRTLFVLLGRGEKNVLIKRRRDRTRGDTILARGTQKTRIGRERGENTVKRLLLRKTEVLDFRRGKKRRKGGPYHTYLTGRAKHTVKKVPWTGDRKKSFPRGACLRGEGEEKGKKKRAGNLTTPQKPQPKPPSKNPSQQKRPNHPNTTHQIANPPPHTHHPPSH